MIFLVLYIGFLIVAPVVSSLVAHYVLGAYMAQWVRESLYICITFYCGCSLWAIRHCSVFEIEREYNIKLGCEREKEMHKMKHAMTTITDMARELIMLKIENSKRLALLQHQRDEAVQEIRKLRRHSTDAQRHVHWHNTLSFSHS